MSANTTLMVYLLRKQSKLSIFRSKPAKISCPRNGIFSNPLKYHVCEKLLSYSTKNSYGSRGKFGLKPPWFPGSLAFFPAVHTTHMNSRERSINLNFQLINKILFRHMYQCFYGTFLVRTHILYMFWSLMTSTDCFNVGKFDSFFETYQSKRKYTGGQK